MTSAQPRVSRRGLLAGSAATIALAGLGSGTPASGVIPAVVDAALPTARDLARAVRQMTELGPRLPGTAAHNAFVDQLHSGFRSAGLRVQRDTHRFTRWLAQDFGLRILDGEHAGAVPVASYYTYSGRTPSSGVVGELSYLGPLPTPSLSGNPLSAEDLQTALQSFAAELPTAVQALVSGVPGGVSGRILVVEAPILPTPLGIVYPLLTYAHDPAHTLSPTDDFKRVFTTLLTLPTLEVFKEAGAAGVVFVLDASPANAKGQYTPFVHGYQDFPALIVDREAGARLRAAATGTPRARLTLRASLDAGVPSDSLVATLPGRSRSGELMIVHTHTDGQNAFEENAGIAMVALARYFAKHRLNRTLVFSCVTGHFAAELPETEGFIHDHPDIVERAVAQLTLEHLGATEWLDDARGYHPSGAIEPAEIFHSLTPIAAAGVESLREADLRRTLLLRPIGPAFFGVGAGLHGAGIPSLAYISAPNYLLALDGKRGHLDKLDANRMRQETRWAAHALRRLDTMPAWLLGLGDTALYRGT